MTAGRNAAYLRTMRTPAGIISAAVMTPCSSGQNSSSNSRTLTRVVDTGVNGRLPLPSMSISSSPSTNRRSSALRATKLILPERATCTCKVDDSTSIWRMNHDTDRLALSPLHEELWFFRTIPVAGGRSVSVCRSMNAATLKRTRNFPTTRSRRAGTTNPAVAVTEHQGRTHSHSVRS